MPRAGRPQEAQERCWEWRRGTSAGRRAESGGRHQLTASAAILCLAPAPAAQTPLQSRPLLLGTRFLGEAETVLCLCRDYSRLRPAPLAASRKERPSHTGSARSVPPLPPPAPAFTPIPVWRRAEIGFSIPAAGSETFERQRTLQASPLWGRCLGTG